MLKHAHSPVFTAHKNIYYLIASKGAVIKFARGSETRGVKLKLAIIRNIHEVKDMLCHNKPLFRPRSEGLGHLAHSVYSLFDVTNWFTLR